MHVCYVEEAEAIRFDSLRENIHDDQEPFCARSRRHQLDLERVDTENLVARGGGDTML